MPILKMNVEAGGPSMANFKATFQFLYDEGLGYIKDWKVNFSEGVIDLCTTASWFNENSPLNKKYKSRKNLFVELGLIQRPRRNKQDHDLVTLNEDQLEKASSFFNSPEYKSTIYEIVSLFKGSNPSGANRRPEAAQIWEVDTENKYNINIFLRYFVVKKFYINRRTNQHEWANSPTFSLENYFCSFPYLKEIFIQFQTPNFNNECIHNASRIAKFAMQRNTIIENDVNFETRRYSRNIQNTYSSIQRAYTMIFQNDNNIENRRLQRAHIFPKSFIKRKMYSNYEDINEYNNWKSMISDSFNFLPLDSNMHDYYDNSDHSIYWDIDGKLKSSNNENLLEFSNFRQIKSGELNEERLKYIRLYKNEFVINH